MGDTDTAVLRNLWNGMPNVKVVEISKYTVNARKKVDDAIREEKDTLVMCGHGTPEGLINPCVVDNERYLIDSRNKDMISAKTVVGIWCHAKQFAERYGVRGFWSSMFISNMGEARMNGIYNTDDDTITHNEIMFCLFTNYLIRKRIGQENWIKMLFQWVDFTDPVIRFNYNGLAFFKEAPVPQVRYDDWYGRIMSYESRRWNW